LLQRDDENSNIINAAPDFTIFFSDKKFPLIFSIGEINATMFE